MKTLIKTWSCNGDRCCRVFTTGIDVMVAYCPKCKRKLVWWNQVARWNR